MNKFLTLWKHEKFPVTLAAYTRVCMYVKKTISNTIEKWEIFCFLAIILKRKNPKNLYPLYILRDVSSDVTFCDETNETQEKTLFQILLFYKGMCYLNTATITPK